MANCACVRVAVTNQRFHSVIHRGGFSSFFIFLRLAKICNGIGEKGWSCGCGDMPIDAIVTFLAGPFGKEGADTVVMVFARVALVAFPF